MDLITYGGGYTFLSLITMCFIFQKAGYKGWYVIIPLYNIYILCKIVFGHGMLFAFGLVFLNPIFLLILALGNSYYRGPDVKYG